jgi:hypothetical protein
MHMIANANASTGMISRGFTMGHFRESGKLEPRSGAGTVPVTKSDTLVTFR